MKKLIFLLPMVALALTGCDGPGGGDVLPTTITISAANNQTLVEIDKTLQLSVNVLPTEASNKDVTWISSNEEIATVSDRGLVEGVSEGDFTITATSVTDTTVFGTIDLEVVTEIPVQTTSLANLLTKANGFQGVTDAVVISPNGNNQGFVIGDSSGYGYVYNTTALNLVVGEDYRFSYTRGEHYGLVQLTNVTVSEANAPVSISEPVATTWTATEVANFMNLTVFAPMYVTMELVGVAAGDYTNGLLSGFNGTVQTNNASSSLQGRDFSITGWITGRQDTGPTFGHALVTDYEVAEVELVPTALTINNPEEDLRVGATRQLDAIVKNQFNTTEEMNQNVTWDTSNPAIATVSPTGLIKGISAGEVSITATATEYELSDTYEIEVKEVNPNDPYKVATMTTNNSAGNSYASPVTIPVTGGAFTATVGQPAGVLGGRSAEAGKNWLGTLTTIIDYETLGLDEEFNTKFAVAAELTTPGAHLDEAFSSVSLTFGSDACDFGKVGYIFAQAMVANNWMNIAVHGGSAGLATSSTVALTPLVHQNIQAEGFRLVVVFSGTPSVRIKIAAVELWANIYAAESNAEGIKVISKNHQVIYAEGATMVDVTNLKICTVLSNGQDGQTIAVTADMVTVLNPNTLDRKQEVRITYGDFDTTYTVLILANSSIEMLINSLSTPYYRDGYTDKAGMFGEMYANFAGFDNLVDAEFASIYDPVFDEAFANIISGAIADFAEQQYNTLFDAELYKRWNETEASIRFLDPLIEQYAVEYEEYDQNGAPAPEWLTTFTQEHAVWLMTEINAGNADPDIRDFLAEYQDTIFFDAESPEYCVAELTEFLVEDRAEHEAEVLELYGTEFQAQAQTEAESQYRDATPEAWPDLAAAAKEIADAETAAALEQIRAELTSEHSDVKEAIETYFAAYLFTITVDECDSLLRRPYAV